MNPIICGARVVRILFCSLVVVGFLFGAGKVLAQFDPNSGPTNLVLQSWSFYDATNWTDDDGYAPLSFTNIAASPLGDDSGANSLVVDTNVPAWLNYNVVESDDTTNLTVENGTVAFWFAPSSWASACDTNGGFGPGEYGRLLEVGSYTPGSSYGLWSIYVDDVGNNLYFSAQTNDLSSNLTTYVTAPIDWTTNYFHYITLTYCATNTTLYLDGVYATNGPGVTVYPGPQVLTNGFWLGSDSSGIYQSHGMFDLVATYGYPMNSNDVWLNYQNQVWPFRMNPNNVPMFSSAATLQSVSSGTNLAIGTFNLSSNLASLFVVNTGPDILYEIQACTNLSQGNWYSEGFLNGSELTNWTLANLPTSKQGDLFLRIRSWQSSDGSGLPDWWEQMYFGTNSVNPNALDSANDGWTIFQKFELGVNPNVFYTPPAPQGLTISSYNAGTGTASLNWLASPGPVSSYQIQTPHGTNTISSGTAYVDTASFLGASYQVRGIYPGGPSAWSASVSVPLNFSISLITGPQNLAYLVVPSLPAGAGTIRITRIDENADSLDDYSFDTNFDLPVTSITNGFLQIPPACVEGPVNIYGVAFHEWSAQILDTNKYALGQSVFLGYGYNSGGSDEPDWLVQPYFDGRVQLKQNLIFQFRDASRYVPFDVVTFTEDIYGNLLSETYSFNPENYVYAGYYDVNNYNGVYGNDGDYISLNAFRPFQDNYLYRNFVFTTTNVDANGFLTTGVQAPASFDDVGTNIALQFPPAFLSLTNANAPVLATNQTRWLAMYPLTLDEADDDNNFYLDYAQYLNQIGFAFQISSGLTWSLTSNVSNYWGLSFLSAEIYYFNLQSNFVNSVLSAGNSVTSLGGEGPVYMETAQPQFQTAAYDFWNPAVSNAIPGTTEFVPSRTSDLLITMVGDPYFNVVSYAKLAVQNGYSGVYGYLGQYFSAAYQITNGVVTTNQTGVLSPYGSFFPTQPGVAALVTMPDPDTGARGTGIVRVIGLNVDANHDSTMDFTYYGPDFVSAGKPFRFWVNDDHDSGDFGGDGIPGLIGSRADGYDYWASSNGTPLYQVHGTRDLVDFFPVYLNLGSLFQSNSFSAGISATDTNWQFVLSQADGVLRFAYTTLTPTNYMNFLLDTNVSGTLASASLTTISSSGIVLPSSFIGSIATNNQGIILVEAAAATTQPLVLTVYQNGNQIAQTSLPLSISGVEQMFRYKNLLIGAATNQSGLLPDRLTDASVPNEPGTTNKNVVFVHGYNVSPTQARGWFADIYKRLYWSGSHAKFYGVNWYGNDSQGDWISGVTANYQTNVVHAFQTAPLLANFIASLTNSGPTVVLAHSLGNMVALSALSDYGAPMNQYFMLDAAVAAEAVDGTIGVNTNMIYTSSYSPWRNYGSYTWASDWYQLFPTNDARSTLTWSNRLANFGGTTVYNFYSSGEEVLRTYTGTPTPSLIGLLAQTIVNNVWRGTPSSAYVWSLQELEKGQSPFNSVLSSSHEGWQLNDTLGSGYVYFINGLRTNIPPSQAAVAPPSLLLVTNAFFNMSYDTAMFTNGTSGSTYAQANRNRILADAIPAVSLPIGANPVSILGATHNFNMSTNTFENGWPLGRLQQTEGNNWHHSDIREVAYTFTYKVFNEIVNDGNLK